MLKITTLALALTAGLLPLATTAILADPPPWSHAGGNDRDDRHGPRFGPPAARWERIPPAPGPYYVWEPGFWSWNGGGYYWVPGHYVYPPHHHARWAPGYWQPQNGIYIFIGGHWF